MCIVTRRSLSGQDHPAAGSRRVRCCGRSGQQTADLHRALFCLRPADRELIELRVVGRLSS
jgi:hypothetical protein